MKSLIYRHTKCHNNDEVTTYYFLGVPVFKRVIIDTEDKPRRACGFTALASDAPVEDCDDDDAEDDEDEQFIILPYGKEETAVRH